MSQRQPRPKDPDLKLNGNGVPPDATPMDRFRLLAGRLLKVRREEIDEAQKRHEEKKQGAGSKGCLQPVGRG